MFRNTFLTLKLVNKFSKETPFVCFSPAIQITWELLQPVVLLQTLSEWPLCSRYWVKARSFFSKTLPLRCSWGGKSSYPCRVLSGISLLIAQISYVSGLAVMSLDSANHSVCSNRNEPGHPVHTLVSFHWPFPKHRITCKFRIFTRLNDHGLFACKNKSPMRKCSLFLSQTEAAVCHPCLNALWKVGNIMWTRKSQT